MPRIKIHVPEDAIHIYTCNIPVLVSHINYGNHLGNDSLISILQEARLRFLKSKDILNETCIESDIGFLITSLAVTYLHEGFHGDLLEVEIFVSDISKKTCDFIYKVTKNANGEKKPVAIATSCLLFFDFKNRNPATIPEKFSNIINNIESC